MTGQSGNPFWDQMVIAGQWEIDFWSRIRKLIPEVEKKHGVTVHVIHDSIDVEGPPEKCQLAQKELLEVVMTTPMRPLSEVKLPEGPKDWSEVEREWQTRKS